MCREGNTQAKIIKRKGTTRGTQRCKKYKEIRKGFEQRGGTRRTDIKKLSEGWLEQHGQGD